MIRSQLARAMSKVLHLPDAIPLSFNEHVVILEAIQRRDADAARAAMQAHLEAALRRYAAATEGNSPPRSRVHGSSTAG
jgi:GntR family transcriptional repressor for pyruvate dehydrogenase complex